MIAGSDDDRLVLRPRPPFRLDHTVWALRRRSRNRLDHWDGTFRRALNVEGDAVAIEVESIGNPQEPGLIINLEAGHLSDAARSSIGAQVARILGTTVDLDVFYELADGDVRVGPLADRFRGVKPPRFPTLFEALVNAIANQQLSLEVGIELLNRFTERFGLRSAGRDGLVAFPEPEMVLGGSVSELRDMGFSTRKAEYLLGCAYAVATGALDEDRLASADPTTQTEKLLELRGIGRWSAEYVLLRGLGRTDVFPADDVGARNKLQRFFDLSAPPNRDAILALLEPWNPVAGMIYFHLLLHGLAERGDLDA